MTKKEQFDRIKNYCLELEKTINKNKQSKKIKIYRLKNK